MFDAPIRKKNVYVSRMKTKRSKPIRVQCNNTRLLGIHEMDEDQGYIVKFGFPRDSLALDKISSWDRDAFQQTMEHFADWFPNSEMTDEQLQTYFRPSITLPSLMTVMASNIQEPIFIHLDDMEVSMHHLYQLEKDVLRTFYCHVEVEAQGLYFHPKKYGIRWIIRKLTFTRQKMHVENEEDILPNHKTEIETQWKEDIATLSLQVQSEIENHRHRISELEQMMKNIQLAMEEAINIPSMNQKWNDALEQVRSEIVNYQRHPN